MGGRLYRISSNWGAVFTEYQAGGPFVEPQAIGGLFVEPKAIGGPFVQNIKQLIL